MNELETHSGVAVLSRTDHWRPRLHYSAQESDLGDPNGLFFREGRWHLQYQTQWPRSWGHASSSDLFDWQEQPHSLQATTSHGCWSGGAVYDESNTSGFFDLGRSGIVSIYTAHNQELNGKPGEQSIALAYSPDEGRTWKRYGKNPVLTGTTPNFRDPKVFWHEPTLRWIMLLTEGKSLSFYGSPNLLEWNKLSNFQPPLTPEIDAFECPDIFLLPVEGSPGQSKWILSTSYLNGGNFAGPFGFGICEQQYFVGEFDGTAFRPEAGMNQSKRLGAGPDEYAAITWPRQADPARTILIGWMGRWGYSGKSPTRPWREHMTLPRELTLHQTSPDDWQLRQAPARELWTLPHETIPIRLEKLEKSGNRQLLGKSRCAALRTVLIPEDNAIIEFEVFASPEVRTKIGCDLARKILYFDRRSSGSPEFHPNFLSRYEVTLPPFADSKLTLDIIIDQGAVEVFANSGAVYMSGNVFPDPQAEEIAVSALWGKVKIQSMELRSNINKNM